MELIHRYVSLSVDICRENEMISHVCTVITKQAVLILYSVTKCYHSRREIKMCSYQSRWSYVGGLGSVDCDKVVGFTWCYAMLIKMVMQIR